MKKVNHYIAIRSFLLAGFCLCHITSQAQDAPAPTTKDSSAIKMAARLFISQTEAEKIQDAYNYRHTEINRLMKTGTMEPKERLRQLKQLVGERNQQLNRLVFSSEKARVKDNNAGYTQVQVRLNAIKERHMQQMSRMPHRQVSSTTSAVNQ